MNNNVIIITELNKDQEFYVSDNEEKTFVIFLTGNKDQNGEVKIIIKGKNARVQILGMIIGTGQQKINLYTLQDHLKPVSVSDLLIKSVLFDEARLNYSGLIKIEKNAQKSNAYQKNQNLLLSPHSWADSRPKLEILANDVRCTHGATIGKIDPNQLYYLMSRGLNEKDSTKLLIEGFFNEVLWRIGEPKIQDKLAKEINQTISELTSQLK